MTEKPLTRIRCPCTHHPVLAEYDTNGHAHIQCKSCDKKTDVTEIIKNNKNLKGQQYHGKDNHQESYY